MNIILCGLPTSGKTTIGKMLSTKLNGNFIGIDQLIENAYFTKTEKIYTCPQIFLEEGELYFRELEKQQIATLKNSVNSIISLGGGSLVDPENVKILQLLGKIVYLKTPFHILWKRIQERGISAFLDPADPETSFHEITKKRIPIYEKASHIIIETEHLNKDEVVQTILKEIQNGQ